MRASGWSGRALATALVIAAAATSGCKSLSERYIALEVWKYERCFGHLPPGFTPPGAQPGAAMPARICGQGGGCQEACPPMASGCNDCGSGGGIVEGGMPMAAPSPTMPSPTMTSQTVGGVTAGKPVLISDELVVP
jgi:hypothetical protein